MSLEAYKQLADEILLRKDHALSDEMARMAKVYEGELPPEYDKFFPTDSPKQVVNLIRLAWDDLATDVGRFPDLRSEPQDNSDKEQKITSLLERIGFSYIRNAEPTGKMMMRMIAWWLVGVGRAVAVVTPDPETKMPRIGVRDPRNAYPNPKKSSGNIIMELEDVMFQYELSEREMKNRGLAMAGPARGSYQTGERTGTVIEFIDDQRWMIVSDGGTVQVAEHGLGMVPAWVFGSFSPNKKALGQFQDQLSFMVAISRLLSQKVRFADRLAHPLLWVRGHEGTIKVGPDVITKLGPQGEMGQISAPVQLQVDRDIEMLQRFSRILNRNPESRQGEVQAKGIYMSAKTLEQLSESIDTVIGGYWDTISVGIQYLVKVCFAMDEKFWPNTEKSISGQIKGKRFRDSYTPKKDIAGRWFINVDHGFGSGGYQGFLQQVQMQAAKLQSRRGALEQMPGISDIDDKLREIELEGVDEAVMANFQALAAQGQLDLVLLSKLRTAMSQEGRPLFEVIVEYEEELRKQAQQAMDQGGADAVTTPAGPEAPPDAGLPSMPPVDAMGF
jgi:hypothetical protein